jgi:hypothetical protein
MARSIAVLVASAVTLCSTAALAEETRRTLYTGVGVGLADGVGSAGELRQLSGAGGELTLDSVYGTHDHWAIGGYGTFSRFGATSPVGSNTSVTAVSAGVQLRHLFTPAKGIHPWLGLGAGYRGLTMMDDRGGERWRSGLQLVRGRLGIDFTVARATRVGPVGGVDVTTFLVDRIVGSPEPQDRTLALFIFGGIAGSFDLLTSPEKQVED